MRKVIVTLVAAGAAAAVIPTAGAIPPGGPGPNTPGTKVVVHEVNAKEKGVIHITATGFAPNARIGIKIDDGKGYSLTGEHGRGNLADKDATFDANGTYEGSIHIPCLDSTAGQHWVRVLSVAGNKRYTSKSVNTFTVTPNATCNH